MDQGAHQQQRSATGKLVMVMIIIISFRPATGKLVMVMISIISFLCIMLGVGFYDLVISFHLPVPKFSVSSAFVSHFNLSSTHHLTADLDITFSVFNPSKTWTAKYGTLDVLIMDVSTSALLANITLSPFSQISRTETSFTVLQSVLSNDDAASDGTIILGVTLLSWVRFEFQGVTTRSYHMRVSCPYIPVGLPSLQAEVPWECEVNL